MAFTLFALAFAAIGLLRPEFFTNHLFHGFEEKPEDTEENDETTELY